MAKTMSLTRRRRIPSGEKCCQHWQCMYGKRVWLSGVGTCSRPEETWGVSSEVCNFSHLYPLSKQKYKLIEGRFPLRNRLGPLFGYVLQAHIQHFHDRLVIWEHTAPFQHLPQGVV